MTTVAIYGFIGKFSGTAEYEFQLPAEGAEHQCMLFIRQDDDAERPELALSEAARFGFIDVELKGFGILNVDVLATEEYAGFSAYYDEAMQHGSSLVYYPNN